MIHGRYLDFPDSFFEPEVRCDHYISKEMKKVWAVEMDLLADLLRVCKKHDIKIFASGGTLLGAVRHKGYVPWDDDIDMMMFRKDFDKLCEVAPEEFKAPHFFQSSQTDKVHRGYAKLRNSETTAVFTGENDPRLPYNMGIFIDIFPLENLTTDKKFFKKQARKVRRWRALALAADDFLSRYYRIDKKGPVWATFVKVLRPILKGPLEKHKAVEYCMRKHERACTLWQDDQSEDVITMTFDRFEQQEKPKRRADFQDLIYMPFEFIEIPVGTGYEHALTSKYGDWRKFVKGASNHGHMIFDADTPYREYLEKVGKKKTEDS